MKILSILNLSNPENPNTDSGVIFHTLLFGHLARQGWKCTIAAPVPLRIPGIKDVPYQVGRSKYEVRFRFDWDAAAQLVELENPDLLFVHQVELVPEYRALLVTLRHSAQIATYCHYWPVVELFPEVKWDVSLNHAGLAQVLMLRILAAATTSDFFFVASEYAARLLQAAASYYHIDITTSRVAILPPPADPLLVAEKPRRFLQAKTVLYNHRLYHHYGTDFLIDLITHYGTRITFVIPDVHGSVSSTRRGLDPHLEEYRRHLKTRPGVRVREDGHIRSIYRDEILGTTDIALAPLRPNAPWSMSVMDCMGLGIPVIAPHLAALIHGGSRNGVAEVA